MKKIKRIGLGAMVLVASLGLPVAVAVSCGKPKGSSNESLGTLSFNNLGTIQYVPKQIGPNNYWLFIIASHTKGIAIDKVNIGPVEYANWVAKGKK